MAIQTQEQEVVVTDIRMKFVSMVVFMIKWAIASIPALLLLTLMGILIWTALVGMTLLLPRNTPESVAKASVGITSKAETTKPDIIEYMAKVLVKNVYVSKPIVGMAGLIGEIENTGDMTLNKVEITIYCLRQDGKPVFKQTHVPVFVTPYSVGDENQPLKPGSMRKFGLQIKDGPLTWAGKVDIKVTSIEFGVDD